MTNDNGENRTGEFSGIPLRRSEGVAGPSREVSQRDQEVSCTEEGAGRNNDEPVWARCHIPEEPAVGDWKTRLRLVQRKTEIIGCDVPVKQRPPRTARQIPGWIEPVGNCRVDLPQNVEALRDGAATNEREMMGIA